MLSHLNDYYFIRNNQSSIFRLEYLEIYRNNFDVM